MASLLLLRGFARAARQVAAPVVPRLLGSSGAAPSRGSRRRLSFLRGASAVDAPPLGRSRPMSSSHTDDDDDAPSPPASGTTGKDFVADDKDLESDEALWALYQRWCKFFNQERDHDEMVRRFPEFKETALSVDRVNKANLPYKFGFNDFADGKRRELCFYNVIDYLDGTPFFESLMSQEDEDGFPDDDDDMSCPRFFKEHGGYLPYSRSFFNENGCPDDKPALWFLKEKACPQAEGTGYESKDGHPKGTGDES